MFSVNVKKFLSFSQKKIKHDRLSLIEGQRLREKDLENNSFPFDSNQKIKILLDLKKFIYCGGDQHNTVQRIQKNK